MSHLVVVVLVVVAPIALLAFIVKAPRAGTNLSRAGLMELQNLLEPERKVEILREQEGKEELLVQLDDEGGTSGGVPSFPGARGCERVLDRVAEDGHREGLVE